MSDFTLMEIVLLKAMVRKENPHYINDTGSYVKYEPDKSTEYKDVFAFNPYKQTEYQAFEGASRPLTETLVNVVAVKICPHCGK